MKEFNYSINGNKYKVEVIKEEGNLVELEVNGTPYTIEVDKPAKPKPVVASRPAPAPVTPKGVPVVTPAKVTTGGSVIKSPLPGVILEINVKVGDTVKSGTKLLVLEAMKMENTIASDNDGKVLEIKVNKGDSVLEGAELLIIG